MKSFLINVSNIIIIIKNCPNDMFNRIHFIFRVCSQQLVASFTDLVVTLHVSYVFYALSVDILCVKFFLFIFSPDFGLPAKC